VATYTKVILSGSTNGLGIKLTDTASSGNTDAGYLIHSAVSGTTDMDEVWLFCHNSSTAGVVLTLEWGGVTAPDNTIEVTIPPEEGLMQVAPGLLLQNGLHIKAFASAANVLTIYGFVNRIDY
tara:strand:- start:618 stop:986 length:369 start_codon:yes stop_codon:yes gene_type:complete